MKFFKMCLSTIILIIPSINSISAPLTPQPFEDQSFYASNYTLAKIIGISEDSKMTIVQLEGQQFKNEFYLKQSSENTNVAEDNYNNLLQKAKQNLGKMVVVKYLTPLAHRMLTDSTVKFSLTSETHPINPGLYDKSNVLFINSEIINLIALPDIEWTNTEIGNKFKFNTIQDSKITPVQEQIAKYVGNIVSVKYVASKYPLLDRMVDIAQNILKITYANTQDRFCKVVVKSAHEKHMVFLSKSKEICQYAENFLTTGGLHGKKELHAWANVSIFYHEIDGENLNMATMLDETNALEILAISSNPRHKVPNFLSSDGQPLTYSVVDNGTHSQNLQTLHEKPTPVNDSLSVFCTSFFNFMVSFFTSAIAN